MTRPEQETPKGWAAVPGLGKAPIIEIVVLVIVMGFMLGGLVLAAGSFIVLLAGSM